MDLPTPFGLALFLQHLGERRDRPIIVVDEPTLAEMPEDNICGLWVEFTDVDQLYVRAEAITFEVGRRAKAMGRRVYATIVGGTALPLDGAWLVQVARAHASSAVIPAWPS